MASTKVTRTSCPVLHLRSSVIVALIVPSLLPCDHQSLYRPKEIVALQVSLTTLSHGPVRSRAHPTVRPLGSAH
jgi:hypothetical protein